MVVSRKNKFFKSEFWLCVDKDNIVLGHVWFTNGYLYATDGRIALKQPLELHGMEQYQATLEGKALLASVFKHADGSKDKIIFDELGMLVGNQSFPYAETNDVDKTRILDDMIKSTDLWDGDFGVDLKLLSMASRLLVNPDHVSMEVKRMVGNFSFLVFESLTLPKEYFIVMEKKIK